uniref:Uncharacterized protein n=1 Tax=Anopheles merus TaxID=30066 RepID=A0A182VFK1_ANOME
MAHVHCNRAVRVGTLLGTKNIHFHRAPPAPTPQTKGNPHTLSNTIRPKPLIDSLFVFLLSRPNRQDRFCASARVEFVVNCTQSDTQRRAGERNNQLLLLVLLLLLLRVTLPLAY